MPINPIKGFYVHDEETGVDGNVGYYYHSLSGMPEVGETFSITESPGYYGGAGNIESPGATTQEVHTNKLSVSPTDRVWWTFYGDERTLQYWIAYCLYDENERIVGTRQVLLPATNVHGEVNGTIEIPDGVSYVSFTYRTFGIANVFSAIRYIGPNLVDAVNSASEKANDALASSYVDVTKTTLMRHIGSEYIRYSDGASVGSSWYMHQYRLFNKGIKRIAVETYAKDSASAAIAFYSTSTVSTDGYMDDYSVQANPGQDTYYADVPDSCQLIAVTYREDFATGETGWFAVHVDLDSALSEYYDSLGVSEQSLTPNLTENLWYRNAQYIRYSDGEPIGSGNYMRWYRIENHGYRKIYAHIYSSDFIPAAIAFYSSETVSADSYMKDASVQAYAGWNSYVADVPDDCVLICVTARQDSADATESEYVKLLGADIATYTWGDMETVSRASSELQGIAYNLVGNQYKPCYDHLFVNRTGDNVVIPHESLYHVRLSRRLGYNAIEANVAATSDGVYVVNHLADGKFGGYFHHVDGETDISDVALNSVTWDWVVENVRYNSQIEKYRTRPCRLEEFLSECKQQNLVPFLGGANQAGIVAIANEIIGKDNYIAYAGDRTLTPSAVIYHWVTRTTKEDILAYCESVGRPFIYGMANPTAFTDEELKEIVGTLHENGYMIGTSYADGLWSNKLRWLGFDFNGTQGLMNRIDVGNLYNVNSIFGFDDFTYTNATESDGVLTFSEAGIIYPTVPDTEYQLCGFDIEVWFEGIISINQRISEFGTPYGFESDGSRPIFVSTPVLNGTPRVILVCQAGTVIKDIKFKASEF